MKLSVCTNSYEVLLKNFIYLYKKTTNITTGIRRIGISMNNVVDEIYEQYDLFTDYEKIKEERSLQKALIDIKSKYGKNAVLKGMNLQEKATARKRNTLVGGHNAE